MPLQIAVDRGLLADFCRRHRVRKLAFFGSVLRSDFRDDSDVDVLYAFEDGYAPDYRVLVSMEEELSAMFGGRRVDLVPADRLKPRIRARVIAEAEVQYAA